MNSRAVSACYPRGNFYPLIDGPTIRNHRFTRTRFRACSTCTSHSQAPIYPYAQRTISDRAEGTFARLRYTLGGDRPSQTTHQALSLTRITDMRLDKRNGQGGISPLTPPNLTAWLHSLPPILHKPFQSPVPSYSKAPRGLFVLLREGRIYTANSISPSLSPRQRSSRYTIRAGQNLPDKEFRYLRTVIVTAAVHRGFS